MAVNPLPNEAEILARIAKGEQNAFTILFRNYERYVYQYGSKLTHSETLALEIVQDIFLKIWLGREKLAKVQNFGAYLNRLVRNHSFNVLRKLAFEAKSSLKIKRDFVENDNSTMLQLDYNETVRILHEALNNLPPQQRIVYDLCHLEGLKYDDAALKMNISPKTVHSHMKQALKNIREHFRKHAVAYPLFFAVLFK
ncbi:RNA polymerase sigma factor [Pedobacter mendelii]|uniref:DNA-directed RNA polymerase sigma-70 factor n=1 Tax=Pedobacter mendelii TaxID=1908240 RepID=A0ABQ2BIW3_9SPHI|nr:RNA polymerase sigma-70 factor [Pedobacter mendelii]GGI25282.1 DNA-directed RNA polymerase sigma-70 factor [Pedobacter mendelii]